MVDKEILIDISDGYFLVAVKDKGKLIDFFFDKFANKKLYPYSSLLTAKVIRNIGKKGFLIKLPNGGTGFLSTRKSYAMGSKVTVVAKTIFDEEKLQRFSDKFIYRTKYFVFKEGKPFVFLSKKLNTISFPNVLKAKIISKLKLNKLRFSVIIRSQAIELKEKSLLTCFSESFTKLIYIFNDLASGIKEEIIYSSKDFVLDMYKDKKDFKIIEEQGIFELTGIWDEIDFYSKEKIFFSSDSYLLVEQTAALCAIDVNTGNDFSRAIDEINLDACDSIVKSIRIKGIGGKIIIDFVPSSLKNRVKIKTILAKMFSSDPITTKIYGWTRGGNFEIDRERSKVPLSFLCR